jgi:endonuclease V-like protein UPF0215 family
LLKKETRILGLSSPRKTHLKPIVGAIFRGSLWLDAIVTHLPGKSVEDDVPRLAAALKKAKQYSQIHVAIFSREDILKHRYQDYKRLSELVKFPVFAISKKPLGRSSRSEFVRIQRGEGRIMLWINDYSPDQAKELYTLGCTNGQSTPEAVRVAELIATTCCKYPESSNT